MLGLYHTLRVVHGAKRLVVRRAGVLGRNFLNGFKVSDRFNGGWLNGERITVSSSNWYWDRRNLLRFQRAPHPALDDFPLSKFTEIALEVDEVPLVGPFFAAFGHEDAVTEVRILTNLTAWNYPWTYKSFLAACSDEFKAMRQGQTQIVLTLRATSDISLAAHFRGCVHRAEELVKAALQECRETLDEESLVTYFDFPEETKSASQQYLAYFTQFLRDLGIESEAQVKEEANRILFTVSPKEGKAALERVREALSAYLQLPSLTDEQRNATLGADIAGLQADANVSHFKAQLMLAAATVQAQRQTISAQEVAIRALQAPLHTPTSPAAPNAPDKEPTIGDLVYVRDYDGKGFSIALAKIARKLKRRPSKPPN